MSSSSSRLNSLWDFSLALYAQPGVADCCLQLQDQREANVNILLWCCWLGARGHLLDEQQLVEALARIQAWDRDYILPLRQLRRQMKAEFGVKDTGIEVVRSSIKQAELHAERQLQRWLEHDVQCSATAIEVDAGKAVQTNIAYYLQSLEVPDGFILQATNILLRALESVSQERR